MSITSLRAGQVRAENLFKIAQQQRAAAATLEERTTLSSSERLEAAELRSHVAMIYQAIGEAYPIWARLWERLAAAEYDIAGRHELAAYLAEDEVQAA